VAYLVLFARGLAAGVLLISGALKLRDRDGFATSLADLLPARVWRVVGLRRSALLVVGAELATAAMVVTPGATLVGLNAAAALFLSFAVLAAVSAIRGRQVPCRCFGASDTPLGAPHAARNGLLCAVAGTGAVAFAVGSGPPVRPAGAVLTLTLVAAAVAVTVLFDDLMFLFAGDHPASG
jgi:Methylamine utilisation protein MauE